MTNQNNAAQPVLTDDEILQVFADIVGNQEDDARFIDVDRDQAIRIARALLSKLRAPASSIREAFELTYAADADDPASATDLFHFTNGWRACVMSQVRAPVADERHAVDPCGYVAVKSSAVDWLKDKFPALTIKAGLCERIGGRLYTITRLMRDHDAVLASAPAANDLTPAGMKEICPECGHQFGCFHSPYIDRLRALASAPVAGEPAFYINSSIIDAGTGRIKAEIRDPLTWSDTPVGNWMTPVFIAPVAGEAVTALNEWFDKTDFIQKRIASGDLPVMYLGWHRADVMRDLIDAAARNQVLPSGCILVQEADTIPHTHPEYGPGIFFTEDAMIEFDAAPQASAEAVRNAALEEAAHLMEQTGKRIAASDIRALKQPQAAQDTRPCSCPSGDGSLRHPCAVHPPSATQPEQGERDDC